MVGNNIMRALVLCLLTVTASAEVRFTGDFESGKVLDVAQPHDGFFIGTLPVKQIGSEHMSSGSGGFGPDSGADTRVVSSERVGDELVKPRRGDYFIRSAIYFEKDYTELTGGRNAPRSRIYVQGHQAEFDDEGYLAFSVYLPKNFEHETGTRDKRGTAMLLQVTAEKASASQFRLHVWVPSHDTVAHWFAIHYHSDTSTTGGAEKIYDLGRVTPDLGRWTDFVLRYRFNPFSQTTNAKQFGGKDQTYGGNRGILQLWKTKQGEMTLTAVNLKNEPVGLVPSTAKIKWHFRLYKFGWHNNPTDVKGPVWAGFDEIRYGRAQDGVTFADVYLMDEAAPRPPHGLVATGN